MNTFEFNLRPDIPEAKQFYILLGPSYSSYEIILCTDDYSLSSKNKRKTISCYSANFLIYF